MPKQKAGAPVGPTLKVITSAKSTHQKILASPQPLIGSIRLNLLSPFCKANVRTYLFHI